MSAAAQTVRPKAAAAAPQTAGRDTTIRRCDACTGTPRYVQAKLKIGASDAPEERQAEQASRAIAAGGTFHVTDPGGSGAVHRIAAKEEAAVTDPGGEAHLRRALGPAGGPAMGPAGGAATTHAAGLIDAARSAPARPLASPVRGRLERGFGTSLHGVQVHTGPAAAASTAAIGARAYAEGSRITLGAGESEHDTTLLAHETTHVLQQGAGGMGAVRRAPPEAPPADDGILSGLDPIAVFWRAIETVAPPAIVALLHDIARDGLFATLKARLQETLHTVFTGLPDIGGGIEATVAGFRSLLATVRTVVVALAAGDCGPFFAALTQLRDAVSEMAGTAWDKIVEVLTPVGDYLADLWKKFGAPVLDWLTAVAGELWGDIKAIGARVWDAISSAGATLRDTVWPAIKHFLGFEDSPDSGGGLGDWIAGKADEAWSAIKTVMSPVLGPLQSVVDGVRAVLPLDAIMHLRETVEEWLAHVGDMADTMGEPDKVEAEQTTLRGTILPAVLRSITGLKTRISDAGGWVASLIGGLAGRVTGFLDGLANNEYLSFAAGLLGFLRTGATSLATWAQETVVGVFDSVGSGLVRLSKFVDPVLQALEKVVSVLGDLMGKLPDLILGPVWWIIPACIKNPIKDFVLKQILSRVPLFQKLAALPDIWAKIEAVALKILKQVFVDGDLKGAAWTFFKSILDVLGIPPSLVTGIIAKAARALNDILHDPVAFLLNMLGALKQGFVQFFNNILKHLLNAIADWMFSAAAEAGIQVPTEFTFSAIAGFVLQVLGITVQKVFERIEKKLGKPAADRLRKMYDKATRIASAVAGGIEAAFEWIGILQREGPAGIIKHLREKLSDLKDKLLGGAVDWLMDKLVNAAMEKLIKMLDPTGVMAVIESLDAIFSAVETLGAKAKQILMAIDSMLDGIGDIAKGVLGRAAGFVEASLAGVVPVLITFLANWMSLGGIGKRIGEIIKTLQGKVEGAIDWLIDKGKGAWDKLTGKGDDGKKPAGGDHPAIAKHVAVELAKPNASAKDVANLRQAKQQQAASLIGENTPLLQPGVKLTITFKEDQHTTTPALNFHISIAPNTTELDGSVAVSDADIEVLRSYYPDRLFAEQEIVNDKLADAPKASAKAQYGLNQKSLFELKPRSRDPVTLISLYSFSQTKASTSSYSSKRNDYGFDNGKISNAAAAEILSKGLIVPASGADRASYSWHKNNGRYRSMRPGSTATNLGFDQVHLGHDDSVEGASEYWNRIGHTQGYSVNLAWNNNPANYWGPERDGESAGSGSSAPLYRIPAHFFGSHTSWL